MSAAHNVMMNLLNRGFDVWLDDENRLLVNHHHDKLTDADREAIRAHLPALKRLCNPNHHDHPEGWSQTPDMPERVALVRSGRLIDSCLFRTAGGAESFLHRVAVGEPQTLAFHAACADEDAAPHLRPNQTAPRPNVEPTQTTIGKPS